MNDSTTTRFFAVTTQGLCATRWISHVLASHPDVFVAHGKLALDSVDRTAFGSEKEAAHGRSLARGNELYAFYEGNSLEEVFDAYRAAAPSARAVGCVHTYTLHTLSQAARAPSILGQSRVVNLLRHPVEFIDSHCALVHGAEKHPPLYHHYLKDVFPQALRQFPELYLLRCPDFRDFVAFAVSCYSVNNLLLDLCYPGARHVRMEDVTTDPALLRECCEELTGLPYPADVVEGFIRAGAINRHRARGHGGPAATYATWAPWQRDVAAVVISGLVLDWLASFGYDLSMLDEPAHATPAGEPAPCLADQLRCLDPRHPLLDFLAPTGGTRLNAIEHDFQGFHLQRVEEKVYAVANALEVTAGDLDESTRRELYEEGFCLGGDSLADLWFALSRLLGDNPKRIEEYRGYNLVTYRDVIHAVRCGTVLDLARLKAQDRKSLIANRDLIVGRSAEAVKRHVDAVLVIEKHGFTEYDLEDDQNPETVQRQIDTILWEEEMWRQREVVSHWPPLSRVLWRTRKGLGRIKRTLVGKP